MDSLAAGGRGTISNLGKGMNSLWVGREGRGGVKPFSLGKKAYQINFNLERQITKRK